MDEEERKKKEAADQLIAFLYKKTGADYHGQS